MKKLFPIPLLLVLCCQSENKEPEIFPVLYPDDNQWIMYEGTVLTESGEELHMDLALHAGSPGLDAEYKLNEWNEERNMYLMGRSSRNRYTTFRGNNPDEVFIQLHDTRVNSKLIFGGESPAELKKIRDSMKRTTDLFFKSKGNELVMVDENFRELNAAKYSLVQRSKPFTVEGYITFVNDTSEFFEMNTRENWSLLNRGQFSKAQASYFQMAKEKFEGIYLKGLAYSVAHVSPTGENIDALVFRNIYEMRPGKKLNP